MRLSSNSVRQGDGTEMENVRRRETEMENVTQEDEAEMESVNE